MKAITPEANSNYGSADHAPVITNLENQLISYFRLDAKIVILNPVLYGGDEQPTIFVRQPMDEFMATKPA